MPKRKQKSFEEIVLASREQERERLGAAIAASRGPLPYGKVASEDDQDALWMTMDGRLQDDAALLQLTLPKEQGGQGLTPLAASLARWKNRGDLMGVGVLPIDDQIKYAERRARRCAEKGVPVTVDWGPAGPPMTPAQSAPQQQVPQMQPPPPDPAQQMPPAAMPGGPMPNMQPRQQTPPAPGMPPTMGG